jgi:hypothetical protein
VTALCTFVGAVLVASGCLALLCLRRVPDAYPPEAAEVPDPVNEAGDEYQRASWFTGSEPFMTGEGVPVVPGDWTVELVDAYDRYRRGEDVYAGAPAEPSPEVHR